MRKLAFVLAALFTLVLSAGSADAQSRPGGCLKYGLGGAIAGHFAGGHRVKGALAGCVLGIYQRRKYEREARERAQDRNRTAERRREPGWDQDRPRPGSRNPANPYEDLGLDIDARRPSGEASRPPGRTRSADRSREGFEPGGSFSRGQYDRRGLPRMDPEPEETGSFLYGNPNAY